MQARTDLSVRGVTPHQLVTMCV